MNAADRDWGALREFLQSSAATEEFKADVEAWMRGEPAPRLHIQGSPPPIKVARVLAKLLEQYPQVPFERVSIAGRSG